MTITSRIDPVWATVARALPRLRRAHAVSRGRVDALLERIQPPRRRPPRLRRRLRGRGAAGRRGAPTRPSAPAIASGPLHGVPIALKDLVELEGRVTTGGSKVWAERVSPVTATLAERAHRGGHDRPRQDPHRRVRDGQLRHQHPSRHARESLGPVRPPDAGRLVQRLRRGGGRGPRARRHRHRHRRLGAPARGLVRHRRAEGDGGTHQHPRRAAALLHARHPGPAGALRRGRRAALSAAQRTRSPRSADARVDAGRSAAHAAARRRRPPPRRDAGRRARGRGRRRARRL